MPEFILGMGSALWLGILTSISPCPLATNIAAISYIGRRVGSARHVVFSGLLYTAGRTLTYLVLGMVLVASMVSAAESSLVLQKYMHLLLGPILILVGMFLLDLVALNFGGGGLGVALQKRMDGLGLWGALPLGIVFALSFCPTSAALFFGSLISLAVPLRSSVVLPAVYGMGTAVPVLVFALLIAFSAQSLGRAFNILSHVEWWARRVTGAVFVLLGIYFSLVYIFEVI